MRNVLVIADLQHASPRVPRLAKYLARYGWLATIVTPPIDRPTDRFGGAPADVREICTVVETEDFRRPGRERAPGDLAPRPPRDGWWWWPAKIVVRSARAVARWCRMRVYQWRWYPDEERDWGPLAKSAAIRLLEQQIYQVIISSSSPVTCHIVAAQLAATRGIPWVAELRDPWTQNHNYPFGLIRRLVEARLERRTLAHASVLLTVSHSWVERLKRLHPSAAIEVVENGFDPELYARTTKLRGRFTITYTGRVYHGKQDPAVIVRAVRLLVDRTACAPADIEVRFYGSRSAPLRRIVRRLGMQEVVRQFGAIAPECALERQRESHVLLLLNWEDSRERGVYPLKVFEYIGARRTILATGGHGDDAVSSLLTATSSGFYCRTANEAADVIEHLYREFAITGAMDHVADAAACDAYSFDSLAKRYASVLSRLCPTEPGSTCA